jgi:D-aspartate ligase
VFRKRILVTNATDDVGLSVIRELATAGHEVVGVDLRSLPLGLRSRYLETVHTLPAPTASCFDQCLVDLVRAVGPDVFLPLGMSSVAAACRQSASLSRLTAINVPSQDAFMAAFDHAVCRTECAQLGIPCPAVHALEEAAHILADGGGRVTLVVKPRMDVGSACGVSYVNGPDALRRCVSACIAQFGGAVVQEHIPGDASAMRTVVVLFDRNSQLIAAFTTRKLRQWPPTGGLTVLSVSTAESHLVELMLPFFRKWRWRGFAEVELKVDFRDGLSKVIEINPRVPAYLPFPIACGLPLARLAAGLALGEATAPIEFPSYAVGKKFANPRLFLRSIVAELRSGSSKAAVFQRAFADLEGTAGVMASMFVDPAPPLGRLLLGVGQILRPRSRA